MDAACPIDRKMRYDFLLHKLYEERRKPCLYDVCSYHHHDLLSLFLGQDDSLCKVFEVFGNQNIRKCLFKILVEHLWPCKILDRDLVDPFLEWICFYF